MYPRSDLGENFDLQSLSHSDLADLKVSTVVKPVILIGICQKSDIGKSINLTE